VRDINRWNCCMCGGGDQISVCPQCGHQLCASCRRNWLQRFASAVMSHRLHCSSMLPRYAAGGY